MKRQRRPSLQQGRLEAAHGGVERGRKDHPGLADLRRRETTVLGALLVIISRMPNDNPLKRIMVALTYRVSATAAAGMLVMPHTPIPGLDAVINIGAPLALLWYWRTFFRDARRGAPEKPTP